MPQTTAIHSLKPHPESAVCPKTRLQVELSVLSDGRLRLSYHLHTEARFIILPAQQAIERADGLWRHTCFEAFFAAAGSTAYREFNFSPSRQWQAYDFSGYRQGARPASIEAPFIERRQLEEALLLHIVLGPKQLPKAGSWRVGLSAVMQSADGGLSYWALRHPPGRPDFHHADAFVLHLSAHAAATR
jgi:hypothetical protein